jgi:siroheme synthase-like protein
VSGYPLVLDGDHLFAVVVGGGAVALRKVRALRGAGARVRIVAPAVVAELAALAEDDAIELRRTAYAAELLADALLVVAATDDPPTNARIAADARTRGCLVNVVDAPELGNCITPAVHRAGDVIVAVTVGGVPGAAARLRDNIGRAVDARVANGIGALASLRRELLARGDRERWATASRALISDDFCDRVAREDFAAEVAAWR